jgi:hypothetical protein
MGKGDRGRRRSRKFIRDFWGVEKIYLECGREEWNIYIYIYIYIVCDFNERWLKDLNFIYCFDVLLSVEGRVVLMINV